MLSTNETQPYRSQEGASQDERANASNLRPDNSTARLNRQDQIG